MSRPGACSEAGASGALAAKLPRSRRPPSLPPVTSPAAPRPPAGPAPPVVAALPPPPLSGARRQGPHPPAHRPREASRRRVPKCRRQRAGRARGDADGPHPAALLAAPAIARHDERRRESAQSDPSREAECEALAGRADDAALGRRRRPRSRQRLPSCEGACGHAQTRRRASGPRSAPRPRCLSGACRVESCLLYTSPSPRDRTRSRMPSSA